MTRVQGSLEQIEEWIADFKDRVMPAVRQTNGYAGSAFLANRETGEADRVDFWESAEALAASGPVAIATRTEPAQSPGLKIVDVERFQIVLLDSAKPPNAPAFSRVDNGHMAPERLDDFADFVGGELVPALRELNGYQSMAIGVDRTSGAVVVTSTWETVEDREASDPSFAVVLQRAAEFTLKPIRIDLYEQAVVELL